MVKIVSSKDFIKPIEIDNEKMIKISQKIEESGYNEYDNDKKNPLQINYLDKIIAFLIFLNCFCNFAF